MAEKLRAVDEAALLGDWPRFCKLQRTQCRRIITMCKRTIPTLDAIIRISTDPAERAEIREKRECLFEAIRRAEAMMAETEALLKKIEKDDEA